jgi:diguanylate cyclase (GGDEF)-like protein/PAS domain S-box-containing protein
MKNNRRDMDLVDKLFEGVYYVDQNRTITAWNHGAHIITGFSKEEVIHRHCYENILNHVNEEGVALCFSGCPLHATMADGEERTANVYLQHKDGQRVPVTVKTVPVRNSQGEIEGAIEVFTEINTDTTFRKNLDRLQKEASEDALTGVPNRKYISAMIESRLREMRSVGVTFGINFIDIDNFKHVNDTYGHAVGDEILKLLVRTVKSGLRKNDMIGRLGGEEFIIIFSDVDQNGLMVASEKTRMLVEASKLRLPEGDLSVTISAGATLALDSDQVETLIQRADDLMYQSKKAGKNRVTTD